MSAPLFPIAQRVQSTLLGSQLVSVSPMKPPAGYKAEEYGYIFYGHKIKVGRQDFTIMIKTLPLVELFGLTYWDKIKYDPVIFQTLTTKVKEQVFKIVREQFGVADYPLGTKTKKKKKNHR